MTHPLIQYAGPIGEGLARDDAARFELRETRRYLEIMRRKAVAEARYSRGVYDRTVLIINGLRAKIEELEAKVVGWGKLFDVLTGRD
jgi:hypothetical protein